MCCSCNSCCSCNCCHEKRVVANDSISGVFTQNIPVTMSYSLSPVNVGGISPFSSPFSSASPYNSDSILQALSGIPTRTYSDGNSCCNS